MSEPSIPKVSTRVDTEEEELTAASVVREIVRLGIRSSSAEALVIEYGRQRVASFAASDEKCAQQFAHRIAELEAERDKLLANRVWLSEPCQSCGATWRNAHSAGCFTHGGD